MKIRLTESQYNLITESSKTQAWHVFDMFKAQMAMPIWLALEEVMLPLLVPYKKIDSRAFLDNRRLERTIFAYGKIPKIYYDKISDCQSLDDDKQHMECKKSVHQYFYDNFDEVMEEFYPLAYNLYDDFNLSYKRAFSLLSNVYDMYNSNRWKQGAIKLYKKRMDVLGDVVDYLSKLYIARDKTKYFQYIQKLLKIPFDLHEFFKETESMTHGDRYSRLSAVNGKYNLPNGLLEALYIEVYQAN